MPGTQRATQMPRNGMRKRSFARVRASPKIPWIDVPRRTRRRRAGRDAPPTHEGGSALVDARGFLPLFPAYVVKKLLYYESSLSLTGTAGVWSQYVFSANGLYDPNVTGTGHQPIGFDTMMLYYEQYTVLASKITITAAGNGIQPVNVVTCLSPDTTTLVVPDVIENGQMVKCVVDGRAGGGYGTGTRIKVLNLSCDVAKYFGRRTKRELVDDVTLSGTVAANPTEQVYFVIGQYGFGAFTDNTAVNFEVLIEYTAQFWEPRKVAANSLHEEKRAAPAARGDGFVSVHLPPDGSSAVHPHIGEELMALRAMARLRLPPS